MSDEETKRLLRKLVDLMGWACWWLFYIMLATVWGCSNLTHLAKK